jgi:hypothetical protein
MLSFRVLFFGCWRMPGSCAWTIRKAAWRRSPCLTRFSRDGHNQRVFFFLWRDLTAPVEVEDPSLPRFLTILVSFALSVTLL